MREKLKVEKINIDLKLFKISISYLGPKEPLVLHFDKPSRRFYLAIIALIANETKKKKAGFVPIRAHSKILSLLDQKLSGKYVSKDKNAMFDKIRKAWRYRLPDLRKGRHFSVLNRDIIRYADGAGSSWEYRCSDDECDKWANLFRYDEREGHTWNFKFSLDTFSNKLDEVRIVFDQDDGQGAWDSFIKNLPKSSDPVEDGDLSEKESFKPMYFNFNHSISIYEHYLQSVKNSHRHLCASNMFSLSTRDLPLSKMYMKLWATSAVPISTVPHLAKYNAFPSTVINNLFGKTEIDHKAPQPVLIEQILKNAFQGWEVSRKRIVFLGSPGSGKTTLLRYLAFTFASKRSQEWDSRIILPLFVNLAQYASAGKEDLLGYAVETAVKNMIPKRKEVVKRNLEESIDRYLSKGKCEERLVFLMDGLDETGEKREIISSEIDRIGNLYEKSFVIVTSRVTGYLEAPLRGFDHYIIKDLTIEDIRTYVENVFLILTAEQNKCTDHQEIGPEILLERQNYLIRQIEENQALRRIASNPLYLSCLVLIAGDPEKDLPKTRAALYQKCFDDSLMKWELKRLHRSGWETPLNAEYLLKAFEEICWVIHRALFGSIEADPTKQLLEEHLSESFPFIDQAIDFWIESGVLITARTKRGHNIILPRHLSFLEYGFAKKLSNLWNDERKRKDIWKHLHENLNNRYLFEPLLLFVGLLEDPGTFFSKMLKVRNDIFYNNTFLVCQAIANCDRQLVKKEVYQKVLNILKGLWHSPTYFPYRVRRDILDCVHLLAGLDGLLELCEEDRKAHTLKFIHAIANVHQSEAQLGIVYLNRLLSDETRIFIRREIARALIQLGERSAGIALLKNLFESNLDFKSRAILAGGFEILEAKDLAVKCYKEMFELERNLLNCLYCIVSIGRYGDKTDTRYLIRIFNKERNPYIRTHIARAIGKVGHIKTAILYLKQLYEKETEVSMRVTIVSTIGMLGERKLAIEYLKHLLKNDENMRNQISIAALIGQFGEKDVAINLLKRLFQEASDTETKHRIVKAILEWNDGISAAPFIENLVETEKDPAVMMNVAYMATHLKDKEVAISVLKLMTKKAKDPYDKVKIARNLGMLGENRLAISVLREIFPNGRNGCIETELLDCLYAITSKGMFLAFEDQKGQLELIAINERYSF